ncbi:MAG: hypothetical protein IKB16_08500 [Lentisphaeria bacterium]|nr:hypothetical protein [Lentisphaeria bacterium]
MAILLGIDIGTTKTACIVYDSYKDLLLFCASEPNQAFTAPGIQDPEKLLAQIKTMLRSIPAALKNEISAVGVTGQMHGIVLWNREVTSSLYTWQSTVSETDLNVVKAVDPTLCQGYGITTLYALQQKEALKNYLFSGTIMDYLVWHLTGQLDKVMIDHTNAASWGAYDLKKHCFKQDVLEQLSIPCELLPEIVPSGTRAGETAWEDDTGLPSGIPVMAAIGDNQASVFFTSHDPENELFLTIGTGSQISAITESVIPGTGCEYRPYPDGRYLAVAASLCGGASWALLASFFRQTLETFGTALSDEMLYRKMDEMALSELHSADIPLVKPSFLGERYDASLRGSIKDLNLHNFTPSKLAAGFAMGIIRNLYDLLPAEVRGTRNQLLCSGNGIRRNQSLQKACAILFGLPCQFPDTREEAACGAALLAERLLD